MGSRHLHPRRGWEVQWGGLRDLVMATRVCSPRTRFSISFAGEEILGVVAAARPSSAGSFAVPRIRNGVDHPHSVLGSAGCCRPGTRCSVSRNAWCCAVVAFGLTSSCHASVGAVFRRSSFGHQPAGSTSKKCGSSRAGVIHSRMKIYDISPSSSERKERGRSR